uniref:Uncharacterized protein n=1 Tax=Rhizophora mucronata TaxID=61149 RepID=A0A2P2MH53_RHIMU
MRKEEFLKEHQDLYSKQTSRSDFPSDFVFGVATSAYQVSFNLIPSTAPLHIVD